MSIRNSSEYSEGNANNSKDGAHASSARATSVDGRGCELPTPEHHDTTPASAVTGGSSSNDRRLCGYLIKHTHKGIVSSAKKRWFVFSDNNCKLYYYKSENDHTPLGEVDVSSATFSFEVTNQEKPGLFFLSAPDRTYELEASNRETCLMWLQELQRRRRQFSRKKTSLFRKHGVARTTSVGVPDSGLLKRETVQLSRESSTQGHMLSLPIPSTSPPGASSQKQEHSPTSGSASWLLSNLKGSKCPVTGYKLSDKSSAAGGSCTPSPSDEKSPKQMSVDGECSSPSGRFSAIRRRFGESFLGKQDKDSHTPTGKSAQCIKCYQFQENMAVMEEDLGACKEVIQMLQKQLDLVCMQKDSLAQLHNDIIDRTHVDIVFSKDKQLHELMEQVKTKDQENEELQNHISSLKSEITLLRERLDVFQETLQAKDQMVINLTDQLSEMETTCTPGAPKSKENLDQLQDTLKAYQIQNKFLNEEILELNLLRNESEGRETKIKIKSSEWEARYYQIQSRYLLLLNELHTPQIGDENDMKELVSQLFEEAISTAGDPEYRATRNIFTRDSECDTFGFYKRNHRSSFILHSNVIKNSCVLRADDQNKSKELEGELLSSRWHNYVMVLGNKELQKSPELKTLIRSGVPYEYKGRIWKACVEMKVKCLKEKLKPGYYQKLLASHHNITTLDPAAKQIELDLLRTLPNNKHYETLHSDGIPKLRRVLLAYSWHNRYVGYCQGLNRLAAIALLFLNEEDSFWLLVAVVEFLMPYDYYSKTLMASQVDQRVLRELLVEKLPKLHEHLQTENVDLSLFTFNWFLCVFVDSMPVESYLHIWDVFLFEGSKVLFRYALAFFKLLEEELLDMSDFMEISRYLRKAADCMVDVKRLKQIAFYELNPFPMRTINSKRAHHTAAVKEELAQLERIRRSYADTESSPRTASAKEDGSDED